MILVDFVFVVEFNRSLMLEDNISDQPIVQKQLVLPRRVRNRICCAPTPWLTLQAQVKGDEGIRELELPEESALLQRG